MRVLLLAAGLGTRLRPLTDSIPKCLVPIGGKPLLQIWLERLSKAGFGPFLINTHHLHEQVETFVRKSRYGSLVKLIYEPTLLGTASTLLKNANFFSGEDECMVIHADNYTECNIKEFVQAHRTRPSSALITMMTFETDSAKDCGIVRLDNAGMVVAFYEKSIEDHGQLANGAVYIFSKESLREMERCYSNARDISKDIIPKFIGRIFSHKTDELFVDIGTTERFDFVNRYLEKKYLRVGFD